MQIDQLNHYQRKLAYEMDSWDLSVALKQGDNVAVVDGRSAEAYELEHIPGAISLCHKDINVHTTEHLDKSVVYVCYCDGIGCNGSTKTAMKLLSLGFQVKELIGGLDWWKRDGHPTEGIEGRAGSGESCGC
ncbi:hypothetical protein VHA01S_031_00110 [Vibrio halioticoli NBRC 102217]|uniref:Rhodanese domain-containing protein n=1 Tax=Vibrio halioticoli NBRC 102217 TaxID=1219072 RepID=V5FEB0_9VIBR|nr:rhodanese-like domain-containing protein [Vibrio halioticoli]GAD89998.1 hypothetical protein VHA01S_031_00110 [Vibrio halioticoli NBRC 102217]